MTKLNINGIDIVGGKNVSIMGGAVVIDGVRHEFSDKLEIRVVEGTIENLSTDKNISCLNVSGDVRAGGSVNCDEIKGNVSAGGSINCDDIGGNVNAGGSVNCDDIGGSVAATVVKRG